MLLKILEALKVKMLSRFSCPWHHRYAVGAFAADSVVRLLDNSLANLLSTFHSFILKRLIRLRWGFTLDVTGVADEDAKFAGAVLAKIAQRGFPAPCSLDLERFLLKQASQTGLLRYVEDKKSGSFVFHTLNYSKNLPNLLKACFFAELLLQDNEVKSLLEHYRTLCSPAESEFFDIVCDSCPDPRLALFLAPQRLIITMLRLTRPREEMQIIGGDQRVDFALEIPNFGIKDKHEDKWMRIVIEIDDGSHQEKGQQKLDAQRDRLLKNNAWEVWRLTVSEKRRWKEKASKLVQMLCSAVTDEVLHAARDIREKFPEEIRRGLTDLVLLPIAEAQLFVLIARWLHAYGTAAIRIANLQKLNLQPIINCINKYLEQLEKLYGLRNFGRPILVDSETEANVVYFLLPSDQAWEYLSIQSPKVVAPTFVFSEYEDALLTGALPHSITKEVDPSVLEQALTYFLQNLFRKVQFREGQTAIILRSLQLKPVVGLLPTAAGKSLCYQMASLLQPGFTIVVQPLRSLMWDQQDNLDAMGIHRSTAIMSHAEVTPDEENRLKEEGYRAIEQGFRLFVFISPERFQIPEFREQVKTFVSNQPIPYCVVDEAHCVSEWGHDFRPAYLNLGRLVKNLCNHRGYSPVFIALTGTASQNVLTDILRDLNIFDPDATVIPESFDRPELNFEVIKETVENRFSRLKSLLKELLDYRAGQPLKDLSSGLIFTYFVDDTQLGVAILRKMLLDAFPELRGKIELYSGRKPSQFKESDRDWELQKINLQRQFKRNEIPIFVCTHSFGMGIDKPDIRFTIHAMLPRSLEEFYQQAGRAGRDGTNSHCIIIFTDDQPNLANEILDPLRVPIEKTSELLNQVPRKQQSDAIRNIWFLRNSFLGKNFDKNIIDYVWRELTKHLPYREGDRRRVEIPFDFLPDNIIKGEGNFSERKQQALEKAIYRLLVVGAVEDYEKDYTGRKFIVYLVRRPIQILYKYFKEYLSRYTTEGESKRYIPIKFPQDYDEAVRLYTHKIVEFVYDHIERRRRRAMWEMLQAARDPKKFREQLMAYMEESEFTKPVKELTKKVSPPEWFALIDKAEGVDGIVKLFGACRRQLEEFPEHPGLLLITGFCRLHYGDEGLRDISGAFFVLRENYPDIDRYNIAKILIERVRTKFPAKLDKVLEAILDGDPSPEIARFCYAEAESYSRTYIKAFFVLVDGILNSLQKGGKNYERIEALKKKKIKICKNKFQKGGKNYERI